MARSKRPYIPVSELRRPRPTQKTKPDTSVVAMGEVSEGGSTARRALTDFRYYYQNQVAGITTQTFLRT